MGKRWRVEKGREGKKGGRDGQGRAGMREGQSRAQAKSWPQNYFPDAGAVESAYWTSY